eukprot:s518_g8.t1
MQRRDSERLGRSTFGCTSSSILGFSRQKALQKMSSAVGLPGLERLVKTTSPQVTEEACPSRSNLFHRSAGKMVAERLADRCPRPASNRPRWLATAYDSDWTLRPELLQSKQSHLDGDCKDWFRNVLRKRKRKGHVAHRMRPDLVAAILEDGGISEEPYHWDPLRDLRVQGPKDSDCSDSSDSMSSSESMNIASLAIVARLGRRRSGLRDESRSSGKAQRRTSRNQTQGLRREKTMMEVKKITVAPEILSLAKLSGKHNIPLQVSEQAFSWWFQFATLDGFIGTEAEVLDGMEFAVPSLGLMSHDAFVQACCAISDVDNPRLLDMEFVGSVLLSVAECLENFGNSGRDPGDESLNGRLDFVEFLAFFHKFCFSEEVDQDRQDGTTNNI